MFYAEGGGCNGFNYRLSLINTSRGENLLKKNSTKCNNKQSRKCYHRSDV